MTQNEIVDHLRLAFWELTLEQRFKLLLGLEKGEVWFGKNSSKRFWHDGKPNPEAYVTDLQQGDHVDKWNKMLRLSEVMQEATAGAYTWALERATAEDMLEAVEVMQDVPTHGAGV